MGAVGVAAHFVGSVGTAVTLLASFSPVFTALTAAAVIVLLGARWWRMAAAALCVTAVGLLAQAPLYLGAKPTAVADMPTLTLLQANILFGRADANALVDLVRRERADVLTVSELTEEAVGRLAGAGLTDVLGHAYLMPQDGGTGGGIYSRFPLTDTSVLPGLAHQNLRAVISPPGAAPVALYALHPIPPFLPPTQRWARELDDIATVLAAERLPLIVGADFNATWDHKRYRKLLAAGGDAGQNLIDAAEFLGSGIVATYPAGRRYPAVLAIDRILARGVTPLTFGRVRLPGSDHHGVLAEIQLGSAPR